MADLNDKEKLEIEFLVRKLRSTAHMVSLYWFDDITKGVMLKAADVIEMLCERLEENNA